MKKFNVAGVGCIFLFVALPGYALDSLSFEVGNNFKDTQTKVVRVGGQWDWNKKWLADGAWFLSGYWDASVGQWHSKDVDGTHDVVDFGFAPVFRYQKAVSSGFIPYVEASVGAHYLTNTDITLHRRFSTHFQFGSHVGAGFRFGKKGEYDLTYVVQHVSNADIDKPNPGIDFHQFRFKYRF